MTFPPPICACCRELLGDVWRVTVPRVFLICGAGGCEQWAWAQGLSYADDEIPPPRRHVVCAHCREQLPRRKRDRFTEGGRQFCTLTCMESASVTSAAAR
jgi:hypothetical protein